jgi:hypothetical protein
MTPRTPTFTLALLLALGAGPAMADDPIRLPDLGGALQSQIDGHLSAILENRARPRQQARAQEPTRSAVHRIEPGTVSAAGRTDEPGWKPYHSAL